MCIFPTKSRPVTYTYFAVRGHAVMDDDSGRISTNKDIIVHWYFLKRGQVRIRGGVLEAPVRCPSLKRAAKYCNHNYRELDAAGMPISGDHR